MQIFGRYTAFWCPYITTHNTLFSKYTNFSCPQNQRCAKPYCTNKIATKINKWIKNKDKCENQVTGNIKGKLYKSQKFTEGIHIWKGWYLWFSYIINSFVTFYKNLPVIIYIVFYTYSLSVDEPLDICSRFGICRSTVDINIVTQRVSESPSSY